ncbi:MAG: hypothetical protein ABMA64_27890 [Myxococcota bacterium]
MVWWFVVGRTAAAGETVAQQNGWAEYAAALGTKIAEVNRACGSTLTGAFDKSTYAAFDPLTDRTESACLQATGTLSAVCATDAGKRAVQSLKAVSCRWSSGGTHASKDGSTLVIDIDPANSGITGKQAGSYSWKSALEEIL